MNPVQLPDRREFLRDTAASTAAIAVPFFVPASSLGLSGRAAPSERIVMASIGGGGQGRHNTGTFLKFDDVQFIAVCDVDRRNSAQDKQQVDTRYGNTDCREYHDFRALLEKEKLDAVHVSTPDHWHGLTSVAALNRGVDVYCEKPLANSVGEAIAIRDAATRNQRVVQTGSHERSGDNARFACELARSGALGKISLVEINMPCGDEWHHKEVLAYTGIPEPQPVPDGFDWNFWLGPTAVQPYNERRAHFWWRFILATGGGEMSDRGAHIIDLAQLALGMDDSGPVEFKARGKRKADCLYDAFMDYEFECTYANGVRLVGANKEPRGLRIVGDSGSLFVHIHGAALEPSTPDLLNLKDLPVQLGRSPGHHRNFIDSVKSREQPLAHAGIGCRTATLCHLLNIAMLTGRALRWDPEKERILDDSDASKLVLPAMRGPWEL